VTEMQLHLIMRPTNGLYWTVSCFYPKRLKHWISFYLSRKYSLARNYWEDPTRLQSVLMTLPRPMTAGFYSKRLRHRMASDELMFR